MMLMMMRIEIVRLQSRAVELRDSLDCSLCEYLDRCHVRGEETHNRKRIIMRAVVRGVRYMKFII